MEREILQQFTQLYNNQNILSDLINSGLNSRYSNSELHCIEAIGKLERPNGTQLATLLSMTRGAVTKLAKRLLQDGLIERYILPDNKKEIYYRLTSTGEVLYKEHEVAHTKWEERDIVFLYSVPIKEQQVILDFLQKFNNYLQAKIQEESL
ncbi:MarR family transcriptional regulator [Lachnoclostridium phytofermentans]|uniref:Transcriptional regulator, MarR family n=1 Tax=Lachnoclostridium phytofermentans (strain ATCC 700394 / DSM 18823 / ISDg) TaxID=357809 RepID=A9KS95_LACP7|nr:MarR family transcriptional regulator [Lachnoclostridium phytofermentans]ABX42127.1 transcriptional regulator, MarR family [Lachnoclostridium phytofermentans ISDg]